MKTAPASTSELHTFYDLVHDIETAMMTTRRTNGHLRSRAMATQKRAPGADLWFVTCEGSAKLVDLAYDPHVNLSYFRNRNREWVSVSGVATISRDRTKIRRLWAPDWKFWFPDEGGEKDGGPDDPRILLIGVNARSAQYMTLEKPQPLVLFELVKSKLTGKTPEIGKVKEVRLRHRASTERAAGRRSSAHRNPDTGVRSGGTSGRRARS